MPNLSFADEDVDALISFLESQTPGHNGLASKTGLAEEPKAKR